MNQHQPLLRVISRTIKRPTVGRIRHQVESEDRFIADRNLRTDAVIKSRDLRDAPSLEYRDKATHADPQARGRLCDGSAERISCPYLRVAQEPAICSSGTTSVL